jgi:hypothetical protein
MTSDRDAKQWLARGVRRQRGTALLPSYLADAGAVIGRPLALSDVLPLEGTDRLFDLYSAGFSAAASDQAPCRHLRIRPGGTPAFFSALGDFGTRIAGPQVILFGRRSEHTGALRLAPGELLRAASEMLRLEKDDLRVSSVDGTCGLLIDNLERENELELWLWGEPWLRQFENASGA